ncbi:MAG: cyclodeaminase/cyclohydrolase family protein [Candidatus Atribacteria bacterium]|nr:cyclodeaminase/cyclohydrolase family protein [Candidatus Atribacteria bacterium]MBE3093020.1 cyclodeaminase/cyclohydrolase family protein [Chloroflexota bacterium]MBE3127869.1 cyclodeaminase/cyclohydrolase family protein [Candidatus Atribacteria bacterium]
MLIDKKINNFLDELASNSPTPGGGSVAALAGALGAALISMVGNLTIGKKKYEDVEEDIKKIISSSGKLRYELSQLIEEDVKVFNNFMATYKMPKETEDEKKIRAEKIQESLIEAAKVPLKVAYKCLDILSLSKEVAEKGNINVVSDAGVAVLMAEAALESAILNVKINLRMIKDEKVRTELSSSIKELLLKEKGQKEKVLEIVESKM